MATTSSEPVSPARSNLLARFVGVITSPRRTFEGVVAHPRWFGMLALVILTLVVLVSGFLMTQSGQDAWVDAATARGEVSDQQYEAVQRMAPYAAYISGVTMLLFIPIMYLVVAGILFLVFNAGMGGNGTFKQLFAVIVHTGPIGILAQLFTIPINYARGSMASATTLSALLPMIDEESFLGRLMGTIDLFLIWQLVILAIGLGVLYRRRTQPIATALFIVYGIVAVTIALVRGWLAG